MQSLKHGFANHTQEIVIESKVSLLRCKNALTAVAAYPEQLIHNDRPEARLTLVRQDGVPVAACSLWWNTGIQLEQGAAGYIGHFEASGAVWAQELLNHACRILNEQKCAVAIGPIDGSTWKRYRFITWRGLQPQFAMEPDNPDRYPSFFLESGFEIVANYYSTASELPTLKKGRMPADVNVRTFNRNRLDEELMTLHSICERSFKNNFLYQPISFVDFCAIYAPCLNKLDTDLILIAEEQGVPCGFLLAVPDLSSDVPTVVLKTTARLPGSRYAGLGRALLEQAHIVAEAKGFNRSIQALMHESNSSFGITRQYGDVIRRYSLFSRDLT